MRRQPLTLSAGMRPSRIPHVRTEWEKGGVASRRRKQGGPRERQLCRPRSHSQRQIQERTGDGICHPCPPPAIPAAKEHSNVRAHLGRAGRGALAQRPGDVARLPWLPRAARRRQGRAQKTNVLATAKSTCRIVQWMGTANANDATSHIHHRMDPRARNWK